jgi:hypothetical protein
MSETIIEKAGERRLVLKPTAQALARQAARARLGQIDPAALRDGHGGQTLADLRAILADLLEIVRRDGGRGT